MPLILLLLGCAYTVEDWWTDLARAHCDCEYDDLKRRDCVDDWMADVEASADWAACHDELAPVAREDVRAWTSDYTETCRPPASPSPQPEDPNWAEACE
ncbi:MAG: hypothetical protein H6739_33130 [Alphaproteobacteria bacterium]|nr:hypothetical protein [Alphaproteobacteria bacterium]